ncbi:hypothetical protein GEU84_006620 [Fertoebacter nigrum]|uniref:Uncharacterized protein n=1 Tax=Fertoeibacter niger TaxID=2656921 RepID=A0A8X8KQG8_9RHOB|nr:hypothetical protein [Fertoeibacter niger]NUB44047.1 hypothetical protein [Fertoeibacter niger]
MTPETLLQAMQVHRALYRRQPSDYVRHLRNAEHFLADAGSQPMVEPLAWVLLAEAGQPIDEGGTGADLTEARKRALLAIGCTEVRHGDAGFKPLWEAYLTRCAFVKTGPSSRKTGRVAEDRTFWVLPPTPV